MNDTTDTAPSFDLVQQTLGFTDEKDALRKTWPLSQESFSSAELGFLDPSLVTAQCRAARLTDALTEATLATASQICQSPEQRRLAWHLHWLLFVNPDGVEPHVRDWPRFPEQFGKLPPLVHLVVLLSGIPHMRQLHRQHGIPETVTEDCLVDFQVWADAYRKRYGAWGLFEVGWIYKSLRGGLFTLGRLQYEVFDYPFKHRLWRDTVTGHVLLLAGREMTFRTDGLVDGIHGVHDDNAWTADYAETDEAVTGQAIDPRGLATRKSVTLPKPRWSELVREGTPCCFFHIPASGPLTPADCADSFRRAVSFYAEYFPEQNVPAYVSNSWLFDEKIERLVAPQSNIAAFLREFYLFPVEGASDSQTLERAFGYGFKSVDDCPQDTSLQRRIAQLMREGVRFNNSGALLVPELLQWGRAVYRETVDPIVKAP